METSTFEFEGVSDAYNSSPLPDIAPSGFQGSHRPLNGSQPTFDGIPWTPSDRPLFELGKGWVLATDDQFQWIVYRRQGRQWLAVRFHCEKAALLRTIREKIDSPYPEALARIESWDLKTVEIKLVESTITIEGHFKEWLNRKENE